MKKLKNNTIIIILSVLLISCFLIFGFKTFQYGLWSGMTTICENYGMEIGYDEFNQIFICKEPGVYSNTTYYDYGGLE